MLLHAASPIGATIRLARLANGISQTRLAQLLKHPSRFRVYEWESGFREPSGDEVNALIEILGPAEFMRAAKAQDALSGSSPEQASEARG